MSNVSTTKKSVINKVLVIAFAAVMVIALVCGILYSLGVFQRGSTAVRIDNHKISAIEYQVTYADKRASFLSEHQDELKELGIDTTQGIDSQTCPYSGFATWKDYFSALAVDSLRQTYVLCDMAEKDKYEMSDSVRSTMQTSLYYMQVYAIYYYGYSDIQEYVTAMYGANVKFSDIENVYEKQYTAEGYYNEVLIDSYGIESDEIQEYYKAHTDDFDVMKYLAYTFEYETVTYDKAASSNKASSAEEAKSMTEANKKAAEEKANEMLNAITDRQSFVSLAFKASGNYVKYKTEEGMTFDTGAISSASGSIADWCLKEGRKTGDTEVFDEDAGFTVVYFIGRALPENPTVSMRHILIKAPEITDTMSDAEKEEAQKTLDEATAKIESIRDEYMAGDKTEEAFAELAKKYSEDAASNGGLYKEFTAGTMVKDINDWMFDEARKDGDVEIITSEYGPHLVYFVGRGRDKYELDIVELLAYDRFEKWYEEDKANHKVSVSKIVTSLI